MSPFALLLARLVTALTAAYALRHDRAGRAAAQAEAHAILGELWTHLEGGD